MWIPVLVAAKVVALSNLKHKASTFDADSPPPIRREFRAAWVATVDNIDWPSKRTLNSDDQRAEMILLLDAAVELHLNGIILQVRPSADALYPSRLEPWSEYLTGQQGRPPQPPYDPLEFAVREAHRRGLELHCWINPYRAESPAQKGPLASSHIAKTHPRSVMKYGPFLWMDPGDRFVQKRTLKVVDDLVRRYDIDGIHMDDYFYPYPEGKQPFPDERTFAAYRKRGGELGLSDWRRKNVDDLVHAMYTEIKKRKPWVLFGISPFGIYRPGIPQGISAGVDQYAELYADAKKWLNLGWCDYFSPQLYWAIASKGQSYPKLLRWWASENVMHRHLWPGLYTSRVDPKEGRWEPSEILNQIQVTRDTPDVDGNIHFSMVAFLRDVRGITDALRAGPYADEALPPASPWLSDQAPAAPQLTRSSGGKVEWTYRGKVKPMWFAFWAKYGTVWRTFVLPGSVYDYALDPQLDSGKLTEVAVAAVSRTGTMGPTANEIVSEAAP